MTELCTARRGRANVDSTRNKSRPRIRHSTHSSISRVTLHSRHCYDLGFTDEETGLRELVRGELRQTAFSSFQEQL